MKTRLKNIVRPCCKYNSIDSFKYINMWRLKFEFWIFHFSTLNYFTINKNHKTFLTIEVRCFHLIFKFSRYTITSKIVLHHCSIRSYYKVSYYISTLQIEVLYLEEKKYWCMFLSLWHYRGFHQSHKAINDLLTSILSLTPSKRGWHMVSAAYISAMFEIIDKCYTVICWCLLGNTKFDL